MQAVSAETAENVTEATQDIRIVDILPLNSTTVEVIFSNQQRLTLDFYGNHIFRLFQDPMGGILRDPVAEPEAKILVDQPRRAVGPLKIGREANRLSVETDRVRVTFDKHSTLMSVTDLRTGRVVLEEAAPVAFDKKQVAVTLKEQPQEYFYGGGVQNGRFSHKGRAIAIENQNSWTDGGVASPNPFYWSTAGYGILWHTFAQGEYDFGRKRQGLVTLSHQTDYLDLFVLVNERPVDLLNDYYQLTGHPVLLPKFGFYEGHLNAYNRDYWKEDTTGILFEDGKRYRESQKDNGGIKESLNGEKQNYQFSARAVIDRYKAHDMPLGWLLPNDGYGAGYGQTGTLDGNIQNLRNLTDYAHENGVEIGLWTQSDLHPKEGVEPLLQRDIVKEVRDAGVRVLKTDVAWVGAGYSFGLNGITDVAQIMTYYGHNARPFIISLDGWAGTQRYAGIWSGDQTGGNWEYIRFHIPTYIGSGLSGNPNITSDMDGIFGGKNLVVNTRDFQWKTFTPMQLNMDGWGSNEKYPHALGEPATSINRWYLKLKSELMPYAYSIAREAVDGLPMMRALFLEYPNRYTWGKATQYEYLYGPYFLVAPIYQSTKADDEGNDVRNGIYLPEGTWIDYFNGDVYEGGRIINNFDAPLWKLPVFVKSGAIIPLANPNNNVHEIDRSLRIYELYPDDYSAFNEYDDDGTTEAYRTEEAFARTYIESQTDDKGRVTITIHPMEGSFDGMVREKATELRVNVTARPKKVTARIGGKKVKLVEVTSPEAFQQGENVCFYEEAPNLNRFATPGTPFAEKVITKNYQFQLRAVNKDGHSDWTAFCFTTKSDPLQFAIRGITGTTSIRNQGGSLRRLFDFEEGELWHTSYDASSVPFDLVADLHAICQLDKFQYVPRENAGNGTLLKGTVSYSMDKQNWTEAGAFEWHRDAGVKVFTFSGQPTARYVRLHVTESVGNFGSGRELYIFKVPDTESYLPGDINHDRLLDENDLTSYTNYTGLRQGDADFEGYISNGDLNRNGLIDAYDISVVATALDGGIAPQRPDTLQGTVTLSTVKKSYQAGETIDIVVRGQGLNGVNALSFALPYDATVYEFAGIEAGAVSGMCNLTNDRLHTSGVKALYPTFVNIGDRETLKGDAVLFTIHLKAKKNVRFDLKAQVGMLVSKQLEYVGF